MYKVDLTSKYFLAKLIRERKLGFLKKIYLLLLSDSHILLWIYFGTYMLTKTKRKQKNLKKLKKKTKKRK